MKFINRYIHTFTATIKTSRPGRDGIPVETTVTNTFKGSFQHNPSPPGTQGGARVDVANATIGALPKTVLTVKENDLITDSNGNSFRVIDKFENRITDETTLTVGYEQ